MMIKEFSNLDEMKKYYDKNTNTYIFKENGKYIDLVGFNFNLRIASNIDARDIYACDITAINIDAHNIYAHNIIAVNIKANNIDARDIDAYNIDAHNIDANDIYAINIEYIVGYKNNS